MSLLPGTRLGPYEIQSVLGAGGMGEVYRAHDTRLGRDVAIKILLPGGNQEREALERFTLEARSASALNHPNICSVFDIGEGDKQPFIVLELLDGQSLADRVAAGALPLPLVLDLGIEIADALEAAHAIGIVHRDIKPANIFLTRRGHAKVLDFGLAKLSADETIVAGDATRTLQQALTSPGSTLGTMAYMSPEQARGETVDERTDLFACGLVLYEMATGERAFAGPTSGVIFDGILNRTPTPIRQLNPALPEGLHTVITKAIEKDRRLRYSSAADLKADLQRVKRDLESGASPLADRVARPGFPLWKRPAVAALVGALLIGAAAPMVWSKIGRTPKASGSIDTLAVLPFTNGSTDNETEYLSDGITESLINDLSQLPKVKVMSRSAAFRFKGREADVQAAGRELGVSAVVTGRVTVHGDDLSVTAELVDASDGHQLWGERYTQKLADLLAVQDKLATRIAENLRVSLTGDDHQRLTRRYTQNSEAYQLYLKGRYYAGKFTKDGFDKGQAYFRQALDLDPGYALAYEGMAYYYNGATDWTIAPRDAWPLAKEAAQKVIALDDTLAVGHSDMAMVYFNFEWDWAAAEREFKRAIALDPGLAEAHSYYGWMLVWLGRKDEGLAELKRSQELDPLSSELNSLYGWHLYYARQYDDAVTQLKKAVELDPTFWFGQSFLGHAYARVGQFAPAFAALEKARANAGTIAEPFATTAIVMALNGKTPDAKHGLDELLARAKTEYVSPFQIASIYAALHDTDNAFAWLNKAVAARSWYVVSLHVDPNLDGLRSDPRFSALVKQVGLPAGK